MWDYQFKILHLPIFQEPITEPGVNKNDDIAPSDTNKKHGLTLGWAAVFVVANIAGSVIVFLS